MRLFEVGRVLLIVWAVLSTPPALGSSDAAPPDATAIEIRQRAAEQCVRFWWKSTWRGLGHRNNQCLAALPDPSSPSGGASPTQSGQMPGQLDCSGICARDAVPPRPTLETAPPHVEAPEGAQQNLSAPACFETAATQLEALDKGIKDPTTKFELRQVYLAYKRRIGRRVAVSSSFSSGGGETDLHISITPSNNGEPRARKLEIDRGEAWLPCLPLWVTGKREDRHGNTQFGAHRQIPGVEGRRIEVTAGTVDVTSGFFAAALPIDSSDAAERQVWLAWWHAGAQHCVCLGRLTLDGALADADASVGLSPYAAWPLEHTSNALVGAKLKLSDDQATVTVSWWQKKALDRVYDCTAAYTITQPRVDAPEHDGGHAEPSQAASHVTCRERLATNAGFPGPSCIPPDGVDQQEHETITGLNTRFEPRTVSFTCPPPDRDESASECPWLPISPGTLRCVVAGECMRSSKSGCDEWLLVREAAHRIAERALARLTLVSRQPVLEGGGTATAGGLLLVVVFVVLCAFGFGMRPGRRRQLHR